MPQEETPQESPKESPKELSKESTEVSFEESFEESLEESPINWKTSLIRYVAWFLTSAGLLGDIYIVREALLSLMKWIGALINNAQRSQGLVPSTSIGFTIDALDRVVLFVLAIAGVTLAILIVYYFRKGEEKGRLYRNIRIVVTTEISVALVAIFIQILTQLLTV